MTFAAQIRRTAALAVALLALGLVALGIGRLAAGGMPQGPLAGAAQAGTAAGAVLFVFGVVGRTLHRWLWHRMIRDSTLALGGRRYRDFHLSGPASGLLRWWLHIDAAGNDRDGN